MDLNNLSQWSQSYGKIPSPMLAIGISWLQQPQATFHQALVSSDLTFSSWGFVFYMVEWNSVELWKLVPGLKTRTGIFHITLKFKAM